MCDMSERGTDSDNDFADIIMRKNKEIKKLQLDNAKLRNL